MLALLSQAQASPTSGPPITLQKPLWQYDCHVWRVEDGLPQNAITAISQTRDGYLWIATEEGLARFDGISFTQFNTGNCPGLISNNISGLLEDGDGNLWINTPGTGLSRYRDGVFSIVCRATSLAGIDMRLDESKRLVIRLDRQFYLWQNGMLHKTVKLNQVSASSLLGAWSEDKEQTFWVSINQNLIYHYQLQGLTQKYSIPVVKGESVSSMAFDHMGSLWVGTDRALYRLLPGQHSFQQIVGPWRHSASQSSVILFDEAGTGWLMMGTSLFRFQSSSAAIPNFQHMTARDGLPDIVQDITLVNGCLQAHCGPRLTNVQTYTDISLYEHKHFFSYGLKQGLSGLARCALRDQEGNVWIGTQDGLNGLRDLPCRTYFIRNGSTITKSVTSVFQDHQGRVWAGMECAGLFQLCGNHLIHIRLKMLQSGTITTIQQDKNGIFWLLCDRKLYRWHEGQITDLSPLFGGSGLSALTLDRNGVLWVTRYNTLFRYQSGVVTAYRSTSTHWGDLNWIYILFAARDGSIWLSTTGNVWRFKDGRFTAYTHKDGLSPVIVTCFYEDADRTLWLGHWGSGLTRWKNGVFQTITTRDGLYADGIYQILADDQDNFWIGSSKGLFRVNRTQLNNKVDGRTRTITCFPYDAQDGAAGGECYAGSQPAAWRGRDGHLYFSARNGLVEVTSQPIDRQPLMVQIESVLANGRAYDAHRPVVIPPGRGALEIDYTVLSFRAPQRINFQYKLLGFDKEWQTPRQPRAAFYMNLPPGNYQFLVRACTRDGVWSTQATQLALTLEPNMMQTLWFQMLCTLLSVMLGLMGLRVWIRGRLRLMKRHTEELEARVALRTTELRTAHEDMQAMHEEVLAQNDELLYTQRILAAQNERLNNLATTDGLTGLKNHRAFQEQLTQAWSESSRYKRPLSVVLLDVDHFKQYNDTFGHPAGDEVLRKVADALSEQARDSDFVARYGGEEFVVILPQTDEAGACALAERFRRAIAARPWAQRSVTASFGVATFLPRALCDAADSAGLVVEADSALYCSKEAGRDQVTHYNDLSQAARCSTRAA